MRFNGQNQIGANTIDIGRLETNFLNGIDWNITNGNNNAKIIGLAAGTNPNDVVIYQQLLNLINGQSWKDAVRVLADSNQSLNGAATIDGVALNDGDRVACFVQTTTTEDGVYEVNTGGAWVRTDDFAVGTDTSSFSFTVKEGTLYDNTQWTISNDKGAGVIGTHDITLVQTSGSGNITASNGLTLVGNDIQLGGQLSASTTIDANGSNLTIGDTAGGSLIHIGSALAGSVSLESHVNVDFKDLEIEGATVTTPIPFSIEATVNYGASGGANATNTQGAVINAFRASFTDIGVINALVELDGRVQGITKTAGEGLTDTAGVFDVVAADLSLSINADDMQVNIGTTNGNSLEVSATGLELVANVTGNRTFSAGTFTVDSAANAISINGVAQTGAITIGNSSAGALVLISNAASSFTSTVSLLLDAPADTVTLANQPTGGTALAVATTQYVDNVEDNTTWVLNGATTVVGQVATLNAAPTNPLQTGKVQVYDNGQKIFETVDYTITNANTGPSRFFNREINSERENIIQG